MGEKKVTYFHGGNRGLHVGDFILPPSETGVTCMAHAHHRKDRAYITPDIVDANFYASDPDHDHPVVYVVKPIGEIEPDPDCNRPGGSFTCEKAEIIAIRSIPGKVIKKARKAMIRHMHEMEALKKAQAEGHGPGAILRTPKPSSICRHV